MDQVPTRSEWRRAAAGIVDAAGPAFHTCSRGPPTPALRDKGSRGRPALGQGTVRRRNQLGRPGHRSATAQRCHGSGPCGISPSQGNKVFGMFLYNLNCNLPNMH